VGGDVPAVRILLALLLTVVALPASAAAHSLVRIGGDTVSYLSADATSLNTLEVRMAGGRIEFSDRTVDGGIDPGTCDPGAITEDANAWIIQVFCGRERIAGARIDLGEREDRATIELPLPVTVLGGPGSDTLRTGSAADRVQGDDGNDDLAGGTGADVLDGGLGFDVVRGDEGDDDIRVADGLLDRVECGAGRDRVDADTLDDVAIDCEDVGRRPVVPPADAAGGVDDRTGPKVEAGGLTRQRLGRGRIRLLATSSERGFLAASGFLDVGGISLPLQSDRRRVTVAGGGVELTVRLRGRRLSRCRRAVRRGRPCSIRMWAVGTDLAGNSTRARPIRVRLR
jgi:Ca2+-binding RTX toxin-like protein